MKKNWKKITAALLTATMLLGTGCGKKEKTEEAAKVTLNEVAHSIFYAPQYTAIELGYAVKATVVHRARESWFLVDDAKFARICPAVIADLHSGAILTNRCPSPKYKQYTLVKETEL